MENLVHAGRSEEECGCSCHRDGGMTQHITSCCWTCPGCGKHIKRLHKEEHVSRCTVSFITLSEPVEPV